MQMTWRYRRYLFASFTPRPDVRQVWTQHPRSNLAKLKKITSFASSEEMAQAFHRGGSEESRKEAANQRRCCLQTQNVLGVWFWDSLFSRCFALILTWQLLIVHASLLEACYVCVCSIHLPDVSCWSVLSKHSIIEPQDNQDLNIYVDQWFPNFFFFSGHTYKYILFSS